MSITRDEIIWADEKDDTATEGQNSQNNTVSYNATAFYNSTSSYNGGFQFNTTDGTFSFDSFDVDFSYNSTAGFNDSAA